MIVSHEISIELQLIYALCSVQVEKNIEKIRELLSNPIDWNNIRDISEKNAVASIIYKTIIDLQLNEFIPASFLKQLKSYYLYNLNRNSILLAHLKNVLQNLNQNKIYPAILKGFSLFTYYEFDFGLRQTGDIDLLIDQENSTRAFGIIQDLGYRKNPEISEWHAENWRKHIDHMTPLKKDDIYIEIHENLFPEEIRRVLQINSLHNSMIIDFYDRKIRRLSNETIVLYLLYHLWKHLRNHDFHLKLLIDIARLINFHTVDLKWEILSGYIHKINEKLACKEILYYANKYLNTPIPETIVKTGITNNFQFHRVVERGKIERFAITSVETVNEQLQNIRGLNNKMKYVIGKIFPSVEFMNYRYTISNNHELINFYLKRLFYALYLLRKKLINKR
ncbi:nucleotidyltransferase family protein [Bacteroidota bacterium]